MNNKKLKTKSNLRKAAVFLVLLLSLSQVSHGAASCEKVLKVKEMSLSKKIRSQVGIYWQFMLREAPQSALAPYLEFSGIVAGDPHLGNATTIPAKLNDSGKRKIMFLNIDFDDAGKAPFVLDFLRLIISSEAINPEIRKRDMEEAYLRGLRGEAIGAPGLVQKLLKMPISDYDALVAKYVGKKTNGDRFKFEEGKLVPFAHATLTRESVLAAIPEYRVHDLGIRPIEGGGSAGNLRVWALVDTADGRRTIIELKQFTETSLTSYQPQDRPESWIQAVREVFWPGVDASSYDLIEVGSEGLFWLREKKVSLIDVPYGSEKKKDRQLVNDLALYNANQMGLAHGRQSSSREYLRLIEQDTDAFHEALKPMAKKFVKWITRPPGS